MILEGGERALDVVMVEKENVGEEWRVSRKDGVNCEDGWNHCQGIMDTMRNMTPAFVPLWATGIPT